MTPRVFTKSPAWCEFFKGIQENLSTAMVPVVNGFPKVLHLSDIEGLTNGMVTKSGNQLTLNFDYGPVEVRCTNCVIVSDKDYKSGVIKTGTVIRYSPGAVIEVVEGKDSIPFSAYSDLYKRISGSLFSQKQNANLCGILSYLVNKGIKCKVAYEANSTVLNDTISSNASRRLPSEVSHGLWYYKGEDILKEVGGALVLGMDRGMLVLSKEPTGATIKMGIPHKVFVGDTQSVKYNLVVEINSVISEEDARIIEEDVIKLMPARAGILSVLRNG